MSKYDLNNTYVGEYIEYNRLVLLGANRSSSSGTFISTSSSLTYTYTTESDLMNQLKIVLTPYLMTANDFNTLESRILDIQNEAQSLAFQNTLDLTKGLFTLESQIAAGKNDLSQMAIDAFNDNTGIDNSESTFYSYDSVNDCFKATGIRIPSQKVVTAYGSVQTTTAQYKFGTASALFDGSGDYLSVPDHNDFDFSTNAFTIDCWIRIPSQPAMNKGFEICSHFTDSSNFMQLRYMNNAGTYQVRFGITTSSTSRVSLYSSTTLTINTWYHVTIVRNGDTFTLYINGVNSNSGTWGSGIYPNFSSAFLVGGNQWDSTQNWNGWIDDFRVTKGVALWTANFTPPTSQAYSTDNTVLLLRMDGLNTGVIFLDTVEKATCDSMNLVSDTLIASSVPSEMFVCAKETLNGGTVTYYVSRDNGVTWMIASKDTLVSIVSQPSGTSLKIKAVTSGSAGDNPISINSWAFGYKLPWNATAILTNLITNGNYDNTTSWVSAYAIGTLSAIANILTVTNDGTTSAVGCKQITSIAVVSSHKYYVSAKMKNSTVAGASYIRVTVGGTISGAAFSPSTYTAEDFTFLSAIAEGSSLVGDLYFKAHGIFGDYGLYSVYVKEAILLDLTEIYGIGNEPDKAIMDVLIASTGFF